jgi:hypothetical protein
MCMCEFVLALLYTIGFAGVIPERALRRTLYGQERCRIEMGKETTEDAAAATAVNMKSLHSFGQLQCGIGPFESMDQSSKLKDWPRNRHRSGSDQVASTDSDCFK